MKVRRFEKSDAHFLIDIDRKGHEHPFIMEDWEVALNATQDSDPDDLWVIEVATVRDTARGFAFSILEPGRLFLVRLVVTPTFRKQGLGTALFDSTLRLARDHGKTKIQTIVSEAECSGVPGDSCEWLISKGFKCTKSSSELFKAYGKDWDGYTFELEL